MYEYQDSIARMPLTNDFIIAFPFGRARHKSAYCISLVVSALKRLDLISDVV